MRVVIGWEDGGESMFSSPEKSMAGTIQHHCRICGKKHTPVNEEEKIRYVMGLLCVFVGFCRRSCDMSYV